MRNNLKFARTNKMIIEAFRELITIKAFSKITVTDICEKAMIQRATFYNHFEGVEHVLNYALQDSKDELISRLENVVTGLKTTDGIKRIVDVFFDFINKKRYLIISIYKLNIESSRYARMLSSALGKVLKKVFDENKDEIFLYTDCTTASMFLATGFTYITLDWVLGKLNYTEEELKELASKFLRLKFLRKTEI